MNLNCGCRFHDDGNFQFFVEGTEEESWMSRMTTFGAVHGVVFRQLLVDDLDQPRALGAYEGHHYRHSCERMGWAS